jgi:hypothetical protein
LIEELNLLQAKLRRLDLLVSDSLRYEFYDRRIPPDIYDGATLTNWLKSDPHALTMTKADLMQEEVGQLREEQFPDAINVRHLNLPLEYKYDPGSQHDGVTLNVPIEALNQVAPEPLSWLVPGLIEEKVLALIRSLPKSLRTRFVPAPETAKRIVPMLRFGEGDIHVAVAAALSRLCGVAVPPDAFQDDRLPAELRMNVRVTNAEGLQLASGRDLQAIRSELGLQAAECFSQVDDPRWTRDGLTDWDFDTLPAEIEIQHGGLSVKAYPTLIDCDDSVSLRLVDSPRRAEIEMHLGLRRLCYLAAEAKLKSQVAWLPNLDKIEIYAATIPGFDLRRQLAELLADRAMVADQPVPRTKEEFKRLVKNGRERIALGVQELTTVIGPLFDIYHQASLALERLCSTTFRTPFPTLHLGSTAGPSGNVSPKKSRAKVSLIGDAITQKTNSTIPSNKKKDATGLPGSASTETPWQYAVDDIREQIARLMDPKTFSKTPWEWLRQYPRYFRAICFRLENLPSGVNRDLQNFEEFQTQWQLYQERAGRIESQGVVNPDLMHLRWMLEEFRVSLFAQKLGTAIPVSPKRLDQQLANIQK